MLQRITAIAFARDAQTLIDNPEIDDDNTETEMPSDDCGNKGILILDATCCPGYIHYPTDIGLLNQSRELTEDIIDVLYKSIHDQYSYKPRT